MGNLRLILSDGVLRKADFGGKSDGRGEEEGDRDVVQEEEEKEEEGSRRGGGAGVGGGR